MLLLADIRELEANKNRWRCLKFDICFTSGLYDIKRIWILYQIFQSAGENLKFRNFWWVVSKLHTSVKSRTYGVKLIFLFHNSKLRYREHEFVITFLVRPVKFWNFHNHHKKCRSSILVWEVALICVEVTQENFKFDQ